MRIIDCIDNIYCPRNILGNNLDIEEVQEIIEDTREDKPKILIAISEEEQRIIDSVHELLYKFKNINRVNVLLKSLLEDKNGI